MTREDAKDLTLSILVVVAVLLVADNVWLHCKCSAQRDELAALGQKLEQHVNPPPGPSMKDRAKDAYDKTKDAMRRGYDKIKASFGKKEEQVPAMR